VVRRRLSNLLGRTGPDSVIPYRLTTLGVVMVAVIAAVLQQAVETTAGIASLVLIPVGYLFSYHRRTERNVLLKVILALALLFAFGIFISTIRGATTVDETRAPLVALFLWVQVLHSFDLPRARDLTFSVAASVALIALAGSLSFSSGFIILVLVYTALLIGALVFGHEAELRADAAGALGRELSGSRVEHVTVERPRSLVRAGAAMLASILAATGVVFVLLPRFPGTNVGALPFSIGRANPIRGFLGDVVNPGRRSSAGGGAATGFDPHAYFGYGSKVDLRVRGRLSDELVMRVRTPRPALYRAQVYDTYRNGSWTSSDDTLETLRAGGLSSITVPPDTRSTTGGDELVQTFYIERELPNLVFHAYRAREVFSSSTQIRVDDFGSLRVPFTLEQDTIYSVVSDVRGEPDELAFPPAPEPVPADFDRFLQVPATLGPRFTALAKRITSPAANPVAKARAVEAWIKQNKRYRLDIPRDPPDKDPVDVFVFDRDEGFCEQIASTMALMLRASGVPTRLVTGFGEGERNLFTGYWEVRNSDAHAWVEVYMGEFGWVTYDPTFGVPASSAADTTFIFKPLARAIGKVIPAEAIRSAFAAVSRIAHVPTWAGPFIVLLVFALIVIGIALSLARRRKGRLRTTDRVVLAWLHVERSLKRRGYVRAPHETVAEFAQRCDDPDVAALAREFGRLRYGREPSDEEVSAFDGMVAAALRRDRVLAK
jgi:protein-glutamine gamma-glutamyltransferase